MHRLRPADLRRTRRRLTVLYRPTRSQLLSGARLVRMRQLMTRNRRITGVSGRSAPTGRIVGTGPDGLVPTGPNGRNAQATPSGDRPVASATAATAPTAIPICAPSI